MGDKDAEGAVCGNAEFYAYVIMCGYLNTLYTIKKWASFSKIGFFVQCHNNGICPIEPDSYKNVQYPIVEN